MAMADGNPASVRELLLMDTIDFYYLHKSWRKRIEAMNKPLKGKS